MNAKPLSLKARAIALLAQREHSAPELRRKLLRIARDRLALEAAKAAAAWAGSAENPGADEVEPAEEPVDETAAEVDVLLVWLQTHGYLSEERFIEGRIHVRAQRFGLQRIKQELAQHGLALDEAQQQALRAGELVRARAICQRKFGSEPASDAAARAKQMRFLAGRGFSTDVILRVLRAED